MADPGHIERLSRLAADHGKLVEAGWLAMRVSITPPGVSLSPLQLTEMRKAYFFGAQHVFASLIAIVELGDEITETDMRRMKSIHDELEAFLDTQRGVK